jgi:hypothetical protein
MEEGCKAQGARLSSISGLLRLQLGPHDTTTDEALGEL